ncbi:hypothetical protein C8N46_105181 [Kordia periserrulae]|uniref:Uncharacterized protein n=1 Tax=Kordia periserrulae TaxID=701523 RepID=A0A2T6BY83_9FLAO|nr:hypothetical protein [Kordia periserrulae]PTX61025.1 hypothetical protein C8N46_105181 [Kordia periserrulae]
MKSIISNVCLLFFFVTIIFGQTSDSLSIEKEWTIEDYQKFTSLLKTLSPDAYPTLKNEATGKLFQKVIAPNYKSFLQNESISVDKKMEYGFTYQQSIREVLNTYATAHVNGNAYGIELSHLVGVIIDFSAETIPVAEIFVKTLNPNDKTYQVRMNGLQQIKYGMKQILEGSFMMIRNTEDSTDEERIILATYFSNAGVDILNYLDASYRTEFKVEIEKYILQESNATVKTLLQSLLQKI